jgi:N-acetylmuramoyl-L-alanine amidase
MTNIQFEGTNGANFTPGRNGCKPVAIINHLMLGTLGGTRKAFRDPAHQASAHYGIGPDGTVLQFVRDDNTAWANGNIRNPGLLHPWLLDAVQTSTNPNRLTLSIEWAGYHVGGTWVKVPYGGDRLDTIQHGTIRQYWVPPEAQYQAGLTLIRTLCAKYHIPTDRAHIGRHSDLDTVTRWFCPGDGFPLQRLLTDLQQSLATP